MKLKCQKTNVTSETLVEPCINDHFGTIILAKGTGEAVLKSKLVAICKTDISGWCKFHLLEISGNKILVILFFIITFFKNHNTLHFIDSNDLDNSKENRNLSPNL